MPLTESRIGKSKPRVRSRALAAKIVLWGCQVDMPCSVCARDKKPCFFSPQSSKCSHCTAKGVPCDGNYSEDAFQKLESEKQKLQRALRALHVRQRKDAQEAESLDRRMEALEKAQGAMIAREARSLEQEELFLESQSNAAGVEAFGEQELAALASFSPGPGFGGGSSQVSQG